MRVAWCGALLVLLSCKTPPPAASGAEEGAPTAPSRTEGDAADGGQEGDVSTATGGRAGRGVDVDAAAGDPAAAVGAPPGPADSLVGLDGYATQPPVWGKSIGHTSVVFKLRLGGGLEAAYKPRSRRGKSRYKGEIAAFRLARALGLPNVPPAVPRAFSLAELRAALGEEASPARKLLDDEAVPDGEGKLPGALIPWIKDLKFTPLESEPSRTEWKGWLSGGRIPDDKVKLAAQISTLIVFDYLTGNWDRWSGGQIGIDDRSGTLLFLDNDGAFFDPPPPGPLASQKRLLDTVVRFSRRLVMALRALDPAALRAALGDDRPGEALLAPAVRDALWNRVRTTLAAVDAKIARSGEDSVLAFE